MNIFFALVHINGIRNKVFAINLLSAIYLHSGVGWHMGLMRPQYMSQKFRIIEGSIASIEDVNTKRATEIRSPFGCVPVSGTVGDESDRFYAIFGSVKRGSIL